MKLKELAKICGVTQSTISRVLNGYTEHFSVKPEVRARIMKAAEEAGFTPNPVYKAIRNRKNQLITALFPMTNDRFSGGPTQDSIYMMANACFRNGYGFSSFYSPAKEDARMESYYYPPFQKAGGYVLPDIAMASQLKYVTSLSVPALALNGKAEGMPWDSVNSAERENMRMILNYLTKRGHRRIFYLNTYPDEPPHYSIAEREAGYLEYCTEYSLPCLEGSALRTNDMWVALEYAIRQRATAIIAYNHYMACDFIHAAWTRGYHVPEDFSIISFNDHPLLKFTIPPLTCFDLATRKMGERAAEILMKRIAETDTDKTPPIHETFTGNIVERESVASVNDPE